MDTQTVITPKAFLLRNWKVHSYENVSEIGALQGGIPSLVRNHAPVSYWLGTTLVMSEGAFDSFRGLRGKKELMT